MAVVVSAGEANPTHDLSLEDATGVKYGFILDGSSPRILQEIPLSSPAQAFDVSQKDWVGGRGRVRHTDDPTGYFDSYHLWSTTEGKIFPTLQWRFAGIRNCEEHLPGDNETMTWYGLYDTTPAAAGHSQYLSVALSASASYNADKCYLWIRKVGTPTGVLTLELCADGTGKPGAAAKSATLAVATITDTVSVFQIFDWATTTALTAGTTYYVNIYGPAGDTATNHWEILCSSTGAGISSPDGSTWAAANVSPFYRITAAETARKWYFFQLQNAMYAVDQHDDRTSSFMYMNGVRGTCTSATATTLVDSDLAMTADQYIGAYIRIFDGTGDGQVRQITDNDATSFTVAAWDVQPDATSLYYVYGTKWMNLVTGTTGLGSVVGQPAVADKIAYFPQGTAVNIRRMRVNATSHDYAADGSNKADILYVTSDPTNGVNIARASDKKATSGISFSATKTWGNALVFGTDKPISNSDYRITNLYMWNLLHVFKEDGPYSLDNGKLRKIGVSFDDIPDPMNGAAVVVDNNGYLWFSHAHSIVKMLGSSASDMLNWRLGYEGLPANRRGTPVKAISVAGWLMFAIDGGSDKYSSVIMWNGMGWSEVFRGWGIGVRIRNIFWQPCPETRGRLWIDINGDLVYIEFPAFSSNPLKDTTLNYQHEGVLVTSTIDAGDPNLYKLFHELRLSIDQGTVEVDYQVDQYVGTDTWTVLTTASTSPVTDVTADLGAKLQLRLRLRLQTANSRTPAIVTGTQVSGRMMPLPKYQYIGTYRMSTDGEDKTGNTDANANTVYTQLKTWATQQTKLTQRSLDPSKDNKVVTITLPAKSVDWIDSEETSWGGRVSFATLEA